MCLHNFPQTFSIYPFYFLIFFFVFEILFVHIKILTFVERFPSLDNIRNVYIIKAKLISK